MLKSGTYNTTICICDVWVEKMRRQKEKEMVDFYEEERSVGMEQEVKI